MFEVVMKLLNRNQKTSKEIAKDRLKVVLIHDRANISPEVKVPRCGVRWVLP